MVRGDDRLREGDNDGACGYFQLPTRARGYDKIGQTEGLARSLAGLAMAAERRGELDDSKMYWEQARAHFDDVGMVEQVAEIDDLLTHKQR